MKSENEILSRLAAYCSSAERCVQDIQKKTQTAGLSDEAEGRIVAALKKEGFIDEARYARCFVNDRLQFNHWGRIKIAQELRRKGIPAAICRESLEAIDEQAYRSGLLDLLAKKQKTLRRKDEHEAFAQLYRFAAGRGFERPAIICCLQQLLKGIDYDSMEWME
ncbi:MAG: RecX family transcriptional regulator [Tannerellaceae bacterium]|jgi:regulatory protein|nr:RecX family transcriptional regulator [Tannerellaceae bacterium]